MCSDQLLTSSAWRHTNVSWAVGACLCRWHADGWQAQNWELQVVGGAMCAGHAQAKSSIAVAKTCPQVLQGACLVCKPGAG